MISTKNTLLLATMLMVLSGCGSARRSEPLTGPMQVSDPSVRRGHALFDQHCYKCHASGEGALAPALNDKPLPRFLIRFQVRHGLGAMPAMSEEEVSEQELEHIIDYMIALRRHG